VRHGSAGVDRVALARLGRSSEALLADLLRARVKTSSR